MSSTFLNQIGLGEFDLGYLLIGMGAVILLLIAFIYRRYQEKKRLKNLADFPDLEHLALEIPQR